MARGRAHGERTLQQFIQSRAAGMENDTCGRQVFHNYADVCWKLRLVDSGCRSDTAVFTGSVAVTRPFVSDVTLHPPNRTHVLRLHVVSVVGGSLPDFGVAVMSGAGSGPSEYPVSAGRSCFMIGGGTDFV